MMISGWGLGAYPDQGRQSASVSATLLSSRSIKGHNNLSLLETFMHAYLSTWN